MDAVLYAMLKNKITETTYDDTEIRQELLKVAENATDMNSSIAQNTNNIEKKLDKNQGASNSGKITGINESGDIVPMFLQGVTYNEDTQCLEYGADEKLNLNAGIQLDDTLSKVGYAADAASVGELKGDIDNQKSKIDTLILSDIIKNGNITTTLFGSTFKIDGNTYKSADNKIQRLSVNDLKNGHKYIMCVKPLSATTEGATSIYLNVKAIYGGTYINDLYPTTHIKIGDVVHFELPSTIDWKTGSDGINYTSICIRSGDAWILSAEIYIYDVSNITANNLSIFDFNSPSATLSIADTVMNIKENPDSFKEKITNWYYGKKMICYGDSITQGGMWRDVVRDKLGFAELTNNGIGGTKISYGGEKDMCSDSRLSNLPTDYHATYPPPGTNDMGGNVPIGTSDYKDGGFDKTTFKGAIAYIITKLHELMPNTMIVFGTPCSGRGTTTGKNMTEQVKNTLNLSTEDYAKAMVEVCHEFSIPVIDVFGTCGINQFNRANYIQDSVHPNWEGHKLVARAIINGLKTNMPIY